jgi:hypothetical protein
MNIRKAALSLMPVLVIASTAVTGTASAAVGLCPVGYVCLVPRSGTPPQLVREGDSRTFSPPLAVREVDNSTRLTYCVFSQASFGLPPGGQAAVTSDVRGVSPAQACPL